MILTWFLFSKFKKYLVLLSPYSCQRVLARMTTPFTFSSYKSSNFSLTSSNHNLFEALGSFSNSLLASLKSC